MPLAKDNVVCRKVNVTRISSASAAGYCQNREESVHAVRNCSPQIKQNPRRANLTDKVGKACLQPREAGKTRLPYAKERGHRTAETLFTSRLTIDTFLKKAVQMTRKSWVDPNTNEPLIDDYAKKMANFMQAFSDGVISESEISDQEARLVDLMRDVEPDLDDETHAKVTKLMCELTAFNIMQLVYEMQMSRATTFRG